MARYLRLGLLLAAAIAGPARAEAPFTPEQRAAIVATVREAMKADPSILRDAIAALQADEARAQEAATRDAVAKAGPALVAAPGDPVLGNPNGDVTLVEFYDVRCPYCRAMLPVMTDLIAADPRLRVVYKDIPILGAGSVLGARAVLAAQAQGGYAKMRAAVLKGPQQVTEESLRAAAEGAGLDWPRLRRDMEDPAIQARIDANLALAHDLGIQGTPAYVVGGKLMPGAVPARDIQAAIEAARAAKG